jgi:lauroyl/myristoyl acyltransferase
MPGERGPTNARAVTAPQPGPAEARGTVRQRLGARALATASWLACRLPERPLIALAGLVGELWYRAAPGRAALGRRNLRRVCTWLAANGLGPERAHLAASDPRGLERLLRAAFRHQARYYLEVARTPGMTPAVIRDRLTVETPEVVAEAFASARPVIFVGAHFGAIELPALYLAERTGRHAVAPMQTVDDPALQRYFARTRGAVGLRIVGLREARRELLASLARGESVGLVADRDLTGGGISTELFGAPAPLPAGPALLAIESGAPVYLTAVRRAEPGRYRGRLEAVPVPSEGSRRERVTGFLAAEARAFERAIAAAPEQWWAIFFPIWPDLEAAAERPTEEGPAEAGAMAGSASATGGTTAAVSTIGAGGPIAGGTVAGGTARAGR